MTGKGITFFFLGKDDPIASDFYQLHEKKMRGGMNKTSSNRSLTKKRLGRGEGDCQRKSCCGRKLQLLRKNNRWLAK